MFSRLSALRVFLWARKPEDVYFFATKRPFVRSSGLSANIFLGFTKKIVENKFCT